MAKPLLTLLLVLLGLVGCRQEDEATVTINVLPNPNKPDAPPTAQSRQLDILAGTSRSAGGSRRYSGERSDQDREWV